MVGESLWNPLFTRSEGLRKNSCLSKLGENFSESQNPFGMFFNGHNLGEPLGKRLCEDLVNFESRLGIFIDQIFGVSKSDWNFVFRCIGAGCGILTPSL